MFAKLSKKTYLFVLIDALIILVVGLILIGLGMNTWFGENLQSNSAIYGFFKVITELGDDLVYILIGASAFFIYDKKFAKNMMLGLLSSVYLNNVLKDAIKDPRPATNIVDGTPIETSYGFPSGHSQSSVTVYGYMAYNVDENHSEGKFEKIIPWILIVIIYLVAISRQIIGTHDVEDIVGGLLIGIGFLLAFIHLEPLISEQINKLGMVLKLILAVAIPLVLFFVTYSILDSTENDYGLVCGAMTGLSVGYLIENEKVQYDPKGLENKWRIINLALGLIITIGLYLVLSIIDLEMPLWRFSKYLILSLVVSLVVPFIFTKISKDK